MLGSLEVSFFFFFALKKYVYKLKLYLLEDMSVVWL